MIRQVFPTERSPTTMILEILNLRPGGRAAQQGGGLTPGAEGFVGWAGITPRPLVSAALRIPVPHPGSASRLCIPAAAAHPGPPCPPPLRPVSPPRRIPVP